MERHCFVQTKKGNRYRKGNLGETSFGEGSLRRRRKVLLGEHRKRLAVPLRHKLEEEASGVTGLCYSS